MSDKIEEGDVFIIDWDKIAKINPNLFICIEPDKEFIVLKPGNLRGSVNYKNKITKGCFCNNCSFGSSSIISTEVIKIIRKRLQIERANKFKSLGI